MLSRKNKLMIFRMSIIGLVLILIGTIIYMFQPKQVNVTIDNQQYTLSTNRYLTSSFLKDMSKKYDFDIDTIDYKDNTGNTLNNKAELVINTEKSLKLHLNNQDVEYKTYKNNLKDLLSEFNESDGKKYKEKGEFINLDYKDKEEEISTKDLNDVNLILYRIDISTKEVEEKFKTKYVENNNLEEGKTKVKEKGVNGKYLEETTKTYHNDKLVDTQTKKLKTLITKKDKVVERGTKKPVVKKSNYQSRANSNAQYSLATFMQMGVINWNGYKFTYYSQSVLPGGGLQIPGRHVSAAGYVVDKDGYIVLASSAAKGTVFDTPFGAQGKVYDRGVSGNHLDVYIR